MNRNIIRFGLAIVLIVTLLSCGYFLRQYLVVDQCLDHGGRWNYQLKACER